MENSRAATSTTWAVQSPNQNSQSNISFLNSTRQRFLAPNNAPPSTTAAQRPTSSTASSSTANTMIHHSPYPLPSILHPPQNAHPHYAPQGHNVAGVGLSHRRASGGASSYDPALAASASASPRGSPQARPDAYFAPNAAMLYNHATAMAAAAAAAAAGSAGRATANDILAASAMYANGSTPRLPPILQVEKQQVTTSATQAASASRRRNEAHFVCPVPGCGSTFTRRFNLRGHLRSHTEERPYVCEWPGCNKGFARQHDCKRHQALHSSKSASNVCSGCGKTFSRLDALNRHLRSEGGAECRRVHPNGSGSAQRPAANDSTAPHDGSPNNANGNGNTNGSRNGNGSGANTPNTMNAPGTPNMSTNGANSLTASPAGSLAGSPMMNGNMSLAPHGHHRSSHGQGHPGHRSVQSSPLIGAGHDLRNLAPELRPHHQLQHQHHQQQQQQRQAHQQYSMSPATHPHALTPHQSPLPHQQQLHPHQQQGSYQAQQQHQMAYVNAMRHSDSGSSHYDSDGGHASGMHSAQVTPGPGPAPSLAAA